MPTFLPRWRVRIGPCVLARVAKYVWSSGFKERRFPTRGKGRGPGGSGGLCFFIDLVISRNQETARTQIREVRITGENSATAWVLPHDRVQASAANFRSIDMFSWLVQS